MSKIHSYRTLVFDCDGVILDSNKVKTEAFWKTALPYGENLAQALVEYHIARGGVSRFKKLEWFMSQLDERLVKTVTLEALLEKFSEHVRAGLAECTVAPAIEHLRFCTPGIRWMVVSGGDEDELKDLFERRRLAWMFDAGIFGSPRTKEQILKSQIAAGKLDRPALFIGDSKYDFTASRSSGLDFVFLRAWSEVSDMEEFIHQNALWAAEDLGELLHEI